MSHTNKESSIKTAFTSVVNFFVWAGQKIKAMYHWLFPGKEEVSNGAMLSWFDKLSANWVNLHWISKIALVAGTTLVSGFIGLIVGHASPFIFSALFLFTICHIALVAHEHHRRKYTKIVADEITEFNYTSEVETNELDAAYKVTFGVTKELVETREQPHDFSKIIPQPSAQSVANLSMFANNLPTQNDAEFDNIQTRIPR
jgi:hypothetical protein